MYSRIFGVTNKLKANLKIINQKPDISEYKQIHRKINIVNKFDTLNTNEQVNQYLSIISILESLLIKLKL